MDNIIFVIFIAMLLTIIGLSILNFKDQILNFMLGIRRKRAIFIDLRLVKFVTLSKDLKDFEMFGKTFVWNFDKELNGACFYRSDMVEALQTSLPNSKIGVRPVDIELLPDKCGYWCDSNEYHTNLKNKLLETLMMLKAKDTIINILMIIVILSLVILALLYFRTNGINQSLDTIQSSITALNQTLRPSPDIVIR